jgi:class 3 adenylate cyclase
MNPVLAKAYAACVEAGFWGGAFDTQWRLVAFTHDLAATIADEIPLNEFLFSARRIDARLAGDAGSNTIEETRREFRLVGGWLVRDLPRDALREMVHPMLRDLVDEVEPDDAQAITRVEQTRSFHERLGFTTTYLRVHDDDGCFVGVVNFQKPAVPMRTLFMLTASGDIAHFERMQQLAAAGRRPAAILFADLEGSSPLAKRLSTATYFSLVRRLTRSFDQCVVDAGGLVGRHVGDGVAAFFVAETAGSESSAALACITAARSLQRAASEVAAHHDLPPDGVIVRAGLHWGTTLYVGAIITAGRSEVTALGDEVNEAARIEACATGGRLLASKGLIERLDPTAAAGLGIDADHVTYTLLADLDTATDKARRDAPAIPVHDIAVGAT